MMHATPNGAHLRGLRLATYAPQNMRHLFGSRWRPNVKTTLRSGTPVYHQPPRHISFFPPRPEPESRVRFTRVASVIITFILLKYWLYPTDELQHLQTGSNLTNKPSQPAPPQRKSDNAKANVKASNSTCYSDEDEGILSRWAKTWESISISESTDSFSDKVVDLILPEWTKSIPGMIRKLQRELIMAPDSLAAEIWEEAHDPYIHPEIKWEARVRVSGDLCEEEKTYMERRRKVIAPALANYLGLKEEDIHPDDIPTIAICGSGGGLRALVAGTGSFLATTEDGLFDCVTYASGVSGSCWLQSLFYSSVTGNNFRRGIDHLKARLGTHIADPPTAFTSLTSAPTNKYLLSGMVEKFKGNSSAEFSLVDVYGVLLAARLLVPKGELGVSEKDFKLSNQRDYIRFGQNPLPIYTAVRHEIPEVHDTEADTGPASEEAKERAKREAWFQWFEITPYEFFCEEFSAGIPTWALGRKFKDGRDVPSGSGLRLPEVRMPLLLGIWGSAFCATLSHYYREIRPLVRSIAGFSTVDEMIWGRNEDLSKVHPIDPASIPNPIYGMHGKLPGTVPETAYNNENIQLMDAGMSNNLPIYPLLRPGRDVDVIISFDASADIKTDNWLSVVEGYAIQRGIKGWPLGIGWPKPTASPATTAKQLDQAESSSSAIEAEEKVNEAKEEHATRQQAEAAAAQDKNQSAMTEAEKHEEAAEELGYCTVWVGTTQERSADPPPPPKPIDDTSSWKLSEPDAGIAVVYLPFLANEDKVPGVDPASNEHMSTWNFVYTPKQIDDVVALAKANYAEGKDQIRATVRAVYERKKKRRLERRRKEKEVRFRRLVRLGKVGKFDQGEQGDHFS